MTDKEGSTTLETPHAPIERTTQGKLKNNDTSKNAFLSNLMNINLY